MYFAKALVAPIVGALLSLLSVVGVTPAMTVEEALGVVISGILVGILTYWVPNKK